VQNLGKGKREFDKSINFHILPMIFLCSLVGMGTMKVKIEAMGKMGWKWRAVR